MIKKMKKCPLCQSKKVERKKITCEVSSKKDKESMFDICSECEYHYCSDHFHDYTSKDSFSPSSMPNNEGSSLRAGDGVRGGREYHIGITALELFNNLKSKKSAPSILIYGAGLSLDHQKLRESGLFKKVVISDLENFQETDHYIKIDDNNKKFDIVVCCEVIEHFINPKVEFANLLGKKKKNGIVVCTTNIHDKQDNVRRLIYPFIQGHTSYYTGQGLISLASRHKLYADFRNLNGSQLEFGPRKKVISFFSNKKYYNIINEYYSRNWLCPSEK